MIVLPAIDIKDKTCVRLLKGDYGTAQKVAEDPFETARKFAREGAKWVHMVDLNGAKDAYPVNRDIFLRIAKETGMNTELGGGIRDMKTIESYLEEGIDARDGMVATEGWMETSAVCYLELAMAMEQMGVKTLIYTDISRDGTLTGVNLDHLEQLNDAVSCRVIASGGVRSIEDIENCAKLGLYGCICGKSIYSGAINLKEAIEKAGEF